VMVLSRVEGFPERPAPPPPPAVAPRKGKRGS
jgi:hypothetical protein